jgi:hypothetical protein
LKDENIRMKMRASFEIQLLFFLLYIWKKTDGLLKNVIFYVIPWNGDLSKMGIPHRPDMAPLKCKGVKE